MMNDHLHFNTTTPTSNRITTVAPIPKPPSITSKVDAGTPKNNLPIGNYHDRYYFTPKHATTKAAAVRAWERRPATPFAPRTATHKIWKRYPLRPLAADASSSVTSAGNNIRGGEGSKRSVKRLKIGMAEDVAGRRIKSGGGRSREEGLNYLGTRFDCLDNEKRKERKIAGQSFDSPNRGHPQSEQRKDSGNANPPECKARRTETHQTADDHHSRSSCSTVHQLQQLKARSVAQSDDDTEYLHAFLTRSKLKSPKREIYEPIELVPWRGKLESVVLSPAHIKDFNKPRGRASSPTKSKPPGIEEKEAIQPTTNSSVNRPVSPEEDHSAQRKKIRPRRAAAQLSRLPTPIATLNTISLHRPNATEVVSLAKTEAQQRSIATRNNTRKNKGAALHPKMKIESLSRQLSITPSPSAFERRKQQDAQVRQPTHLVKQVKWDERLAYFAQEPASSSSSSSSSTAAVSMAQDDAPHRPHGSLDTGLICTPLRRSKRTAEAPLRGTPAPRRQMAESAAGGPPPLSTSRSRSRDRLK